MDCGEETPKLILRFDESETSSSEDYLNSRNEEIPSSSQTWSVLRTPEFNRYECDDDTSPARKRRNLNNIDYQHGYGIPNTFDTLRTNDEEIVENLEGSNLQQQNSPTSDVEEISEELASTSENNSTWENFLCSLPEIEIHREETFTDSFEAPTLDTKSFNDFMRKNWKFIRGGKKVFKTKRRKIIDAYSIILRHRKPLTTEICEIADQIVDHETNLFRLCIRIKILLKNLKSSELRIFQASENTTIYSASEPIFHSRTEAKKHIREVLQRTDIPNIAFNNRESSSYVLLNVIGIEVLIYQVKDVLIGGCLASEIPNFIKRKKSLLSCPITGNGYKKMQANDVKSCFWEAIEGFRARKESRPTRLSFVKKLMYDWSMFKNLQNYNGSVALKDVGEIEQFLRVGIQIFTCGDLKPINIHKSKFKNLDSFIQMDFTGDHYSLIVNWTQYASDYHCVKCQRCFSFTESRHRHAKNESCSTEITESFPQKIYFPQQGLTKTLRANGINDTINDPYFVIFDFESILIKTPNESNSMKSTKVLDTHHPICYALSTNLPDEDDIVFTHKDPVILIRRFYSDLKRLSNHASDLKRQLVRNIRMKVQEQMEICDREKRKCHSLKALLKSINRWVSQLTSLGFNSGRYDLVLIRPYLIEEIFKREGVMPKFIKAQGSYIHVETESIRFIDIMKFLSPSVSLRNWLLSMKVDTTKTYFPYRFLDDISKLDYPSLPERHFFENIDQEIYDNLLKTWNEKGFQNFQAFMEYYCKIDCIGPREAVGKMKDYYLEQHSIDVFKDFITLPAVSELIAYKKIVAGSFCVSHSKTFYNELRKNILGGIVQIFHRCSLKNKTILRPYEGGTQLSQTVLGLDANSLYLHCQEKDLPNGYGYLWEKVGEDFVYTSPSAVRRMRIKNVSPRVKEEYQHRISNFEQELIAYCEHEFGRENVHSALNGEQTRIGNVPVDIFIESNNTVFMSNGCFWHAHRLCGQFYRQPLEQAQERYERTAINADFIRAMGFNLVEIYECEWKVDPRRRGFEINTKLTPSQNKGKMSQKDMIDAIRNDTLFGMAKVSLSIPSEKWGQFLEMVPLFKHDTRSQSDMTGIMREYAEEEGYLKRPQSQLVSTFSISKTWMLTKLISFLLNLGVTLDSIHEVMEYQPVKMFRHFADFVTENRRAGDRDPDMKPISETSKLIGNSFYGKQLSSKIKYNNAHFLDIEKQHKKMDLFLQGNTFKDLTMITENIVEISLRKHKVSQNRPLIIGSAILDYSKLHIMQMYFNFIRPYHKYSHYQLLLSDTDSLYFTLGGQSLRDIVRDDVNMEEYNREEKSWMVTDEYSRRVPGLFKVEAQADNLIALSSKTYCLFNDEETIKKSHKGVKRSDDITWERYLSVLQTTQPRSGDVKGMRLMPYDGKIHTFEMVRRNAFPFLYSKRHVCRDRISTFPMEIGRLLENSPHPNEPVYVSRLRKEIEKHGEKVLHSLLSFNS